MLTELVDDEQAESEKKVTPAGPLKFTVVFPVTLVAFEEVS